MNQIPVVFQVFSRSSQILGVFQVFQVFQVAEHPVLVPSHNLFGFFRNSSPKLTEDFFLVPNHNLFGIFCNSSPKLTEDLFCCFFSLKSQSFWDFLKSSSKLATGKLFRGGHKFLRGGTNPKVQNIPHVFAKIYQCSRAARNFLGGTCPLCPPEYALGSDSRLQ